MPCWNVKFFEMKLEAANQDLLISALSALGYEPTKFVDGSITIRPGAGIYGAITIKDGKLYGSETTTGRMEEVAGKIKGAYAAEAVKVAAKRFGFSVKQSADNKLTLKKG